MPSIPTDPPASRIVPGSVTVGGEPLELERRYKVQGGGRGQGRQQQGGRGSCQQGDGAGRGLVHVQHPMQAKRAGARCSRSVARRARHPVSPPNYLLHPLLLPPLLLPPLLQVATKAYLRGGKDGFESLKAANVLVDGETNPRLATLVQVRLLLLPPLPPSLLLLLPPLPQLLLLPPLPPLFCRRPCRCCWEWT